MRIIEPKVFIVNFDEGKVPKLIERIGRVCYKSEGKITGESAEDFIADKVRMGHESIIEHEKITVLFICDRGVSHEIVRHRIASYSQESTRYCNYSNDKFGKEITVINPFFLSGLAKQIWRNTCEVAEKGYFEMLAHGCQAQEARSVLPNSLKTEIFVTYNLREWRHFFSLRTSPRAHPQMRQIAIPLLLELKKRLPVFFDDIKYDDQFWNGNFASVSTFTLE
jgi:thymidylate synthase (FAD)